MSSGGRGGKRRGPPPPAPSGAAAKRANPSPGMPQPPPPAAAEEDMMDEDVFLDESILAEDEAALLMLQRDEALASRLARWKRPALPSDLAAGCSRAVAFQQLEIDYVIGESHKELLPNSSGSAAILRIFGVTREGHSICCQVHGFEPYFYIGCPSGMGPDDISRFHQTLEGRMMLDSSDSASAAAAAAAAEAGAGAVAGQVQPQRRTVGAVPQAHDGGYASGGWEREDGKLSCGYSSFRGKRATMEDFYDVKLTEIDGQAVSLFGVFDGHGGSRAAEYLREHLFENLLKHPDFLTDTKLAISETYQKTDTDFLESEASAFRDDGSTASTAVLVGDHLYVANVGDSRAVISKAGKAMALSEDHKPNRIDERKRIENAGGIVIWAGTWRVGGVLAMSRAFGNRLLKPYVVAEPEIQEEQVNGELECLVLASDGLWDVVENEEAVSLGKSEDAPESAARKLTEIAYSRGSADNITCIVVQFHHDKTG